MAGELEIKIKKDECKKTAFARTVMSPNTRHAITSEFFTSTTGGRDQHDTKSTDNEIQRRIENVKNGDMSDIEATLVAQTITLDAIFHEMAYRASLNMGEHLQATETYMRMALKSQAQSRCTIEALNEMKNPKSITITKQANISDQQIVNNGTMNTGSTHAGENVKESNELLLSEVKHETVDSRTKTSPKRANTASKAVETINRRKNSKGKG